MQVREFEYNFLGAGAHSYNLAEQKRPTFTAIADNFGFYREYLRSRSIYRQSEKALSTKILVNFSLLTKKL